MIRNWLDPRAVLLAAVLAFAAALPVMTTSVERRDYYFFDVALTSSSAGTTQVFWDIGRGFNEYDSSRQPLRIEPVPVVYRYMLPMGRMKALRFDPIDGIGEFILSHARIVDHRGRVAHEFTPEDFRPFREIAHVEGRGESLYVRTMPGSRDPILLLRLPRAITLASNSRIWFELGWPVMWKVFLAGVLLGLPPVARRLGGWAGALGRRARSRPGAAIATAAVLAVGLQCHPVIFLGRSFASPGNGALMLYGEQPTLPRPGDREYVLTNTMSSDTGALLFQHLYYPMAQREALRHGELPLWNRWSLCGEPLLGQGQSMFGDPFNFLTILADGAAWAWDLRFLLARWLFATGLGLTVWRLTRHLGSALVVTVSGVFISFFTYRLVHPANFSVCYAPWILWAWARLMDARSGRDEALGLAALVAANWTVMTSGTMKEAYMLIAGLNLAGVLLVALRSETAGRRLRLLGLASAAGAGFLLLTAPLWLSFLVAWKHSYTGYDVPNAYPLPLTHLIGFFDEMFYRQTTYGENVLAPSLNFVFLLGGLWWFVQPRLWRTDRTGAALLLAAVLPFVFAFGLVPVSVMLEIPIIRNIGHVGNTFSSVLLVLAAVLAGCGFHDALTRLRASGWWRTGALTLAAGAGLAVLFLLTTPLDRYSAFFAGYAPALALGALALPAGLRWAASDAARPGALWVVLVLGIPLLCWRHSQFGSSFFNHYAFVPGSRADLHAPSPAVALVDENRRAPGRVVGWGNNLFPSYNTALRWEGLYGVDAVRSLHYQELAVEFGLQRVWVWDWRNEETDAPQLVPAHDLMNVTHYVATHRAGPRAITGLELLGQRDLDVYASPTAWPRAFFTDRLGTYATPRDFAAQVRGGDGRPFAATQAGRQDAPALPATLEGRTVAAATDYHLTPNTTSFVINAPGPGVAVLAETYYAEDFQVTVDGKPVPFFRVNHAFKGVAIGSAGRHEIRFAYWPQHFTLALRLGAAGFALLLAGFIWLSRSAPPTNAGAAAA